MWVRPNQGLGRICHHHIYCSRVQGISGHIQAWPDTGSALTQRSTLHFVPLDVYNERLLLCILEYPGFVLHLPPDCAHHAVLFFSAPHPSVHCLGRTSPPIRWTFVYHIVSVQHRIRRRALDSEDSKEPDGSFRSFFYNIRRTPHLHTLEASCSPKE